MNQIKPFAYEINSSFSKALPKLQLAWDSTSLGIFKECPRKYYYAMVLGYDGNLDNPFLKFGTYFHSCTELYDKLKAQGADHEEALQAAAKNALEITATYNEDKTKWRPWVSDEPTRSRAILFRTVIWYLEHWKNDPIKTFILADGKPAVELSFRFDFLDAPTGEKFMLCGHLDRVGVFHDDLWVVDKKTTKATLPSPTTKGTDYFKQFSPDNQMSLYNLGSQVILGTPAKGVMIDAIQCAVDFNRFARGQAPRNKAQTEEFVKDTQIYLHLAFLYAESNYWPMNDKSCFRCVFRDICEKGPQVREDWLERGFKRKVWNPLEVR